MTGWFRLRTILLVTCASVVPLGTALGQNVISLDVITVLATKLKERAIEALAGVSTANEEEIAEELPARLEDVIVGMPGVYASSYADDPAMGFNIRGLQDYGRVAVTVDGARQNFEVAQHGPQGKVYLDPELLSSIEVARGPVTNINGSGAIGGAVALKTKDADDILGDGERFGAVFDGIAGTNEGPLLGSVFLAARPNEAFDITAGFSARHNDDYTDGNGDLVADSGSDTLSGLVNARFRPSEGQQLKIGAILQQFDFTSGIGDDDSGNYDNSVKTTAVTGEYTFDDPGNPLLNLSANAYWNRGEATTTTIKEDPYGGMFTKSVGTTSGYNLDTIGFSASNVSEFDRGDWKHTLTLGADAFQDTVESTGSSADADAGFLMTASGERQVYGGFAQWRAQYGDFLDVIGGLRFDGYNTTSASYEGEGQRLSPKITVGLSPFEGFTFYGSYAEGYRAPSVNEAFVTSYHPGYFFSFLPNPSLRPEIGHTLEAGINVEQHDYLTAGDVVTFKGNIFQNNVTDYIGLEEIPNGTGGCSGSHPVYFYPLDCYQYQNFASVVIRGIEVESKYDAQRWFAQGSATILDSEDKATGEALDTVMPVMAYASIGARFLDGKLSIAPNWKFYGGAGTYQSYHLLGLSASYAPNEYALVSLVLDNILNQQYTPFLSNDPGAGFTAKASLKVKLAR